MVHWSQMDAYFVRIPVIGNNEPESRKMPNPLRIAQSFIYIVFLRYIGLTLSSQTTSRR